MIKRIIHILKYGEDPQQTQVHQAEPVVPKPKPDIFQSIYGLEAQKRLIKRHLHASSPTSFLITGHPGLAKSALIECIETRYPEKTIKMDGTGLTAAGIRKEVKERHDDLQKDLFIWVDEIEKADKTATNVFLNILEGGRLTKRMAHESYDLKDLRITLMATCNDFEKLKKTQGPLVDRITIIGVQKPTMEEFYAICEMRLPKEGVDTETALYIASETYKVYGPDMREAVRISKMAKTPQDVDEVISDLKAVGVQ